MPTPDEPSSHPEIKDGDPVARLQIPAIGVDQVVVSGVFSDDLSHGPGHYPATPLPGEVGNAGIAGHRTTYGSPFGDLDKLHPGDEIIVTTTAGRFRYVVAGSKIVEPSDASVLAPTNDVRLTLTTCHPRYSTARRLIVTAVLDPQSPNEPVATTAAAPATTPPPVTPATTNVPATDVPVTTTPAPTTTVGAVTTVTPPTTAAAHDAPDHGGANHGSDHDGRRRAAGERRLPGELAEVLGVPSRSDVVCSRRTHRPAGNRSAGADQHRRGPTAPGTSTSATRIPATP